MSGKINIGNPYVNVDVDCCNKDKKKKEDKKCCECKGFVDFEFGPNDRFVADICPNCTLKGSRVLDQFGMNLFTSKTVNPPNCFTTEESSDLTTSGEGEFLFNGVLYDGVYSLIMKKRPGISDLVTLTFSGESAGGMFLNSLTVLTIPEVMIEDCKKKDCRCGSSHHRASTAGGSETMTQNRSVVVTPDGSVEVFER